MPPHTLSVVPTPLGNLGDITLRALDVLRAADAILAEDTRVTRKLCSHFGISTPLRSHHKFSEAAQIERICAELREGAYLALVSDAGTPGISDPGGRLIRAVQADPALHLEVLPGPVALITALLTAGFAEQPFQFLGFVPRTRKDRLQLWDSLRATPLVTVLYEAPGRVRDTLVEAAEVLGPARPAALAKELTKLHERTVRGSLGALPGMLPDEAWRGEFVLLIGPAPPQSAESASGLSPSAIARLLRAAGLSPKGARAILAQLTGLSPSRAYSLLREALPDEAAGPS